MIDLDLWSRTRRDLFRAFLVDPHDLTRVRGELSGIDLSGTSVAEGYYTDTRVQAKVVTRFPASSTDGWRDYSWVRLVHEVPDWGYREDMMTGLVLSRDLATTWGTAKATYDLESSLYAIAYDLIPWRWTCAKAASALRSAERLLDTCGRRWVSLGAHDGRYGDVKTFDVAQSALSTLFKLTDQAGDRIGVRGSDGAVTIAPYVVPSRIPPVVTLDDRDPRGIVVGEVTRTSDEGKVAGRSIVTSGSADKERLASADAPSSAASSSSRRGWMMAVSHSETGTGGKDLTQDQLRARARGYLASDSAPDTEWSLATRWLPLHQGDGVTLVVHGASHHTFVKSVERDLGTRECKLTLKEA